jgi:hypothetical protein
MNPVTERIELLRKRTLGEVVGDTFTFIRLNLAVIFKVHFLLSLPIIIVTAGIFLVLFRDYFSLLRTIESGPFVDSIAFRDDVTTRTVSMLFSFMALLPISTNTFLIVDRYYHSKTGKVTFEEVLAVAKKKYLPVFVAKLVMAPIIFFTGLILVLPGIAFYTLFLCVELLIIQHHYGIFKAIGRSSGIMSRYFWNPFLYSILFLSIYTLFTSMIELPVGLLEQATNLTTGSVDIDSPLTIVALSLRAFNTIAGFMLYTIPTVALALIYYSIREASSQATIMERIRAIGTEKQKQKKEYKLGDEQY